VTHTLETEPSVRGAVLWHVVVAPVHDRCVEAILDRIEAAVRTGTIPTVTRRPMPRRAALMFALVGRMRRARRK
jgi:hypothetical protein